MTLSVGQLATRTGLTVRALHHYEEVGLLAPERTDAGHRRYGPADIERVQQIVSLRALGTPLAEIGAVLRAPDFDPVALLDQQRQRLDAEAVRLDALRQRLDGLSRLLRQRQASGAPIPPDAFTDLIRAMEHIEKHYTPEQLEHLAERRDALGEDAIRAVEAEWPRLFEKVGDVMDRGVAPAAPEARALIDRWDELVAMFTDHDPGITQSLGNVWRHERESASQMMGLDPDRMQRLFAYAQRVRDARDD
ncbi:MAG: MerR family transcriptional regulator [Bacteroidota bacterium]